MAKVKVQYVRGGKVKTMHSRYAKILERVGLVKPFARPEPKKKPVVKVEKPKPEPVFTADGETSGDKPKRKYRRRDLQADE